MHAERVLGGISRECFERVAAKYGVPFAFPPATSVATTGCTATFGIILGTVSCAFSAPIHPMLFVCHGKQHPKLVQHLVHLGVEPIHLRFE